MKKSDIIAAITANYLYLTKSDAEDIVNVFFDNIKDALINNDRVELRGLGSFSIRDRDARVGRNPKTGDHVNIGKKKIPFFKAGRKLRDIINK